MRYEDATERLREVRARIAELRNELREVQSKIEPAEVQDYRLTTADGKPVQLSELFGDREHLFVVHNMGRSCSYCTMWADGFNRVIDHLENRAAFVVSTPDSPRDAAQVRREQGLELSHGVPRGYELCQRPRLPQGRELVAGGFRVPARRRSHQSLRFTSVRWFLPFSRR